MTTNTDDVTLDNPQMTDCSDDYARRCKSIGMKRRNPRDLDSAMRHPKFNERHHQLLDDLAKEYEASRPIMERAPWLTVTIGTHQDKESLRQAVLDEGHRISDWSEEVIKNEKFAVETTERKLELFTATVKEVTGKDRARVDEIYARLDELGFGICPHETALQLRREFKDQPMDTFWIVISEPLAGADGRLRVLYVARDSFGSWVDGSYARSDGVWDGDYPRVFCRK